MAEVAETAAEPVTEAAEGREGHGQRPAASGTRGGCVEDGDETVFSDPPGIKLCLPVLLCLLGVSDGLKVYCSVV